jgi:hypothetical protein
MNLDEVFTNPALPLLTLGLSVLRPGMNSVKVSALLCDREIGIILLCLVVPHQSHDADIGVAHQCLPQVVEAVSIVGLYKVRRAAVFVYRDVVKSPSKSILKRLAFCLMSTGSLQDSEADERLQQSPHSRHLHGGASSLDPFWRALRQ